MTAFYIICFICYFQLRKSLSADQKEYHQYVPYQQRDGWYAV